MSLWLETEAQLASPSPFTSDVVLVDDSPEPRPPSDDDVIVLDTPPQPAPANPSPETIFIDDSPRKRRRTDAASPPPLPAPLEPDHVSPVIVVDDDELNHSPQPHPAPRIRTHPRHPLERPRTRSHPSRTHLLSIEQRHRSASRHRRPAPIAPPGLFPNSSHFNDHSDDIIETSAAGPRLRAPRHNLPGPIRIEPVNPVQPVLPHFNPGPVLPSSPEILCNEARRSMPSPPFQGWPSPASSSLPPRAASPRPAARRRTPFAGQVDFGVFGDLPIVNRRGAPSYPAYQRAPAPRAGPSSAAPSHATPPVMPSADEQLRHDGRHRRYTRTFHTVHVLNDSSDVVGPIHPRVQEAQQPPPTSGHTPSSTRRVHPIMNPRQRHASPLPIRRRIAHSTVRWPRFQQGSSSGSNSHTQPTFDTSPDQWQIAALSAAGTLRGSDVRHVVSVPGGLHSWGGPQGTMRRSVAPRSATATSSTSGSSPRAFPRSVHAMRTTSGSRSRRSPVGVGPGHGGSRRRINSSFIQSATGMSSFLTFMGASTLEVELQGERLDYEDLIRLDEQLMRDKNRAEKTQIESLPVTTAAAEDKEIRCCICMCDVEEGEELRELPCSHKYHRRCIDEWLTYNGCCPVDKKRIAPPRSRRRCAIHRN